MVIRIRNLQRSKSLNLRKVRKDLAKALVLLGLGNAELSLLFVGRRRMKQLNTAYRGIPRETDVLSFPMTEEGWAPFASPHASHCEPFIMLGDIVVSVPKVTEQAKNYRTTFHVELLRLLIHGLLHLIGYDHEADKRTRLKMEKKEKELFHALQRMA